MATFTEQPIPNPVPYHPSFASRVWDEIRYMFKRIIPKEAPVTSFNNSSTPAASAEPGIKNPA